MNVSNSLFPKTRNTKIQAKFREGISTKCVHRYRMAYYKQTDLNITTKDLTHYNKNVYAMGEQIDCRIEQGPTNCSPVNSE